VDDQLELERMLSTLATREDIRAENQRLREHITMLMARRERKIQALIDAIEFMKHLDS